MQIKVSFSKVRKFLVTAILVIAAFGGGYYLGVQGFKAEVTKALRITITRQVPPDKNVDMSLFWQVWDTLSAKYYDKGKLVPSQMVYGAIEGMVGSAGDPYTRFLTPNQKKMLDDDLKGSLAGVGIEIGYIKMNLAVIAPLAGSPAEKAGVKAGDFIIHIKDTARNVDVDTANLLLDQAITDIRGDAGTKVTLTLARVGNPKPIIVEITREIINIPTIKLEYVGKNSDIAHVRLSRFGEKTTAEWDAAINEVQKKNIKGLIIDLRNNGGGFLQDAIDIASDFVPANTTVVIQKSGDGSKQEFKSDRLERLGNYKVVVLINGGSASASEILAGALRDDRGIKLIGEKSFGKGTIQEPLKFPGGSGLNVTTAEWLTPDGQWFHGKGLMPDVVVTPKDSDTTDVQLDAAINQF